MFSSTVMSNTNSNFDIILELLLDYCFDNIPSSPQSDFIQPQPASTRRSIHVTENSKFAHAVTLHLSSKQFLSACLDYNH